MVLKSTSASTQTTQIITKKQMQAAENLLDKINSHKERYTGNYFDGESGLSINLREVEEQTKKDSYKLAGNLPEKVGYSRAMLIKARKATYLAIAIFGKEIKSKSVEINKEIAQNIFQKFIASQIEQNNKNPKRDIILSEEQIDCIVDRFEKGDDDFRVVPEWHENFLGNMKKAYKGNMATKDIEDACKCVFLAKQQFLKKETYNNTEAATRLNHIFKQFKANLAYRKDVDFSSASSSSPFAHASESREAIKCFTEQQMQAAMDVADMIYDTPVESLPDEYKDKTFGIKIKPFDILQDVHYYKYLNLPEDVKEHPEYSDYIGVPHLLSKTRLAIYAAFSMYKKEIEDHSNNANDRKELAVNTFNQFAKNYYAKANGSNFPQSSESSSNPTVSVDDHNNTDVDLTLSKKLREVHFDVGNGVPLEYARLFLNRLPASVWDNVVSGKFGNFANKFADRVVQAKLESSSKKSFKITSPNDCDISYVDMISAIYNLVVASEGNSAADDGSSNSTSTNSISDSFLASISHMLQRNKNIREVFKSSLKEYCKLAAIDESLFFNDSKPKRNKEDKQNIRQNFENTSFDTTLDVSFYNNGIALSKQVAKLQSSYGNCDENKYRLLVNKSDKTLYLYALAGDGELVNRYIFDSKDDAYAQVYSYLRNEGLRVDDLNDADNLAMHKEGLLNVLKLSLNHAKKYTKETVPSSTSSSSNANNSAQTDSSSSSKHPVAQARRSDKVDLDIVVCKDDGAMDDELSALISNPANDVTHNNKYVLFYNEANKQFFVRAVDGYGKLINRYIANEDYDQLSEVYAVINEYGSEQDFIDCVKNNDDYLELYKNDLLALLKREFNHLVSTAPVDPNTGESVFVKSSAKIFNQDVARVECNPANDAPIRTRANADSEYVATVSTPLARGKACAISDRSPVIATASLPLAWGKARAQCYPTYTSNLSLPLAWEKTRAQCFPAHTANLSLQLTWTKTRAQCFPVHTRFLKRAMCFPTRYMKKVACYNSSVEQASMLFAYNGIEEQARRIMALRKGTQLETSQDTSIKFDHVRLKNINPVLYSSFVKHLCILKGINEVKKYPVLLADVQKARV